MSSDVTPVAVEIEICPSISPLPLVPEFEFGDVLSLLSQRHEDSADSGGSDPSSEVILWVWPVRLLEIINWELLLSVTWNSITSTSRSHQTHSDPAQADLRKVFNDNNSTFNLFDMKSVKILLRKRDNYRSRTGNPPSSFYPQNCPKWTLSPSPRANCDQQHVIMATSSAPNTAYRQRLRDQLGNKYFLLFLLGSGPDQGLLEDEARQFGDILQVELEEEYRALPYKILLGYVWVNRYCGPYSKERCQTRNLPSEMEINKGFSYHRCLLPSTYLFDIFPQYISKIDDDTLVDFTLLDSLLAQTDLTNKISCPSVMRNQKPWRHPQAQVMGKWTNLIEGILPRYFSIKIIEGL